MGVDFTAIFDHRLRWDELVALPDVIRPLWTDPPGAIAVHPNLNDDRRPWRWRLDRNFSSAAEELFDAKHVSLEGPVGFSGTVFPKAIEITHLARWWSFVFQPEVRDGLLTATTFLARALRSTTVIYVPDSGLSSAQGGDLVFDGASAEEVINWLAANVGPPAVTIESLGRGSEDLEDRGYFVEHLRVAG